MKIRIICTSEKELTFNKKKITKNTYKEIHTFLQPEKIEYIKSIAILHKSLPKLTVKSLEFFVKEIIDETQFLEFIAKMKNVGFETETKKSTIQLVDNDGTVVYCYHFLTATPCRKFKKPKSKTDAKYSQETLFNGKS